MTINQYQVKANELLEKLCTSKGIKASLSSEANYEAIFTRDAIMEGIAGLLFKNALKSDIYLYING